MNLGIFICMQCSGIHRSLGVHVSQVRSTTLDTWLPEQVEHISCTGNRKANEFWEANLPTNFERPKEMDRIGLETFIKRKYVQRAFVKDQEGEAKPSKPEPMPRTNGNANFARFTSMDKIENRMGVKESNQSTREIRKEVAPGWDAHLAGRHSKAQQVHGQACEGGENQHKALERAAQGTNNLDSRAQPQPSKPLDLLHGEEPLLSLSAPEPVTPVVQDMPEVDLLSFEDDYVGPSKTRGWKDFIDPSSAAAPPSTGSEGASQTKQQQGLAEPLQNQLKKSSKSHEEILQLFDAPQYSHSSYYALEGYAAFTPRHGRISTAASGGYPPYPPNQGSVGSRGQPGTNRNAKHGYHPLG